MKKETEGYSEEWMVQIIMDGRELLRLRRTDEGIVCDRAASDIIDATDAVCVLMRALDWADAYVGTFDEYPRELEED